MASTSTSSTTIVRPHIVKAPFLDYIWDDDEDQFTDVQLSTKGWRRTKPECSSHVEPSAPSDATATRFRDNESFLMGLSSFTREQRAGEAGPSEQSIADEYFGKALRRAIEHHDLADVRPPTEQCATSGGTSTERGEHKVALLSLEQSSAIGSDATGTRFPPSQISERALSDATVCPLDQRRIVHDDIWREDGKYVHRVSLATAPLSWNQTGTRQSSFAPGVYTSKGYDSEEARHHKAVWDCLDEMKQSGHDV
ncbi:hypothetical protein IAU59_005799 [Kwoniella sp. CBS 9459]